MQLISYSTENFKVASERTEGIPSHAVEIQGELIRINKRNLEKWGIKSSAVDGIIAAGNGIPIRMCNSPDPHDCDYKHDHYSDIGYVTKMWHEGDWIYSRAAITDKNASQKVKDGTWMPMNEGKWSVAGYPGSDIDDDGMLEKYIPASISFVPSPNKPAFEGSKFELVAAAVNEIKAELQLENDKQSKEEDIMTDDKTDIKPDNPDKKDEVPDTKDVNEEPKVDHKVEPKIEPKADDKSTGDESTMYDQKEYDAKLAEALETQKAEFEAQMAQMTNNNELESMLSAAKKETVEATLDEIRRAKLSAEYMDLVVASKVFGAPLMTDGKVDEAKLKAKVDSVRQLTASAIEGMINETKMMVAAMPAGHTAFDDAKIKADVVEIGISSKFTVGDCKGRDK